MKKRQIYYNDTYNFISPIKNKRINLISLNKSIFIPSLNSLTKCSTNRKSNSFCGQIPLHAKNKLIPIIKKFNDSNDYSSPLKLETNIPKKNTNIKSIKLFHNKINNFNYNNKSSSFIKINSNNNNNNMLPSLSINYNISKNIKNKKSTSPFNLYNFDNLSFIKKKECVEIGNSRNSIKLNPITMYNSPINGGCIKSIFNKRNTNIKINIMNEIKKNSFFTNFKTKNLYMKQMKNKDLNEINETIKINKMYIDKNNKNDKFMYFLLKNNNTGKIKKIDKIKKDIVILNKKQIIKNKNENIKYNNKNINKYYTYKNIYEYLKKYLDKQWNIYNLSKENDIIDKNIFINIKIIKSINSTKGNINNYLSIKYKSKEVYLNYIKNHKINKSNSLTPDYNLLEMKLLHINIEYEINLNKQLLKSNQNKQYKQCTSKKVNYLLDFYKLKDIIKKKKNIKIYSNKYWENFSLLKNVSFFNKNKNKNKKHIPIHQKKNSLLIKQYYHKFNRNSKILIKQFLKHDDFKKLRNLINTKRESQFEFECFKIINNYDINTCDEVGNTLLTIACINGDFKIAQYLLKNGANPNCVNLYKNTPLHYALANHDYRIADLLIKNGAKDYLENKDGNTAWYKNNN